jgi:hypothetical protein
MNPQTLQKMDAHFAKWPRCKAERPATKEEISAAESILKVRFSEDYLHFLANYGGAVIGSETVIGLIRAPRMGNDEASVVDVTLHFRGQKWPGCDGWYVVSIDERGNPVGIDERGEAWISDHDGGGVRCVAQNLGDWIERKCFE